MDLTKCASEYKIQTASSVITTPNWMPTKTKIAPPSPHSKPGIVLKLTTKIVYLVNFIIYFLGYQVGYTDGHN